jgi:carboxyl-terminal processing protease
VVENLFQKKLKFKFFLLIVLTALIAGGFIFYHHEAVAQEEGNGNLLEIFSISYHRLLQEYLQPLKPNELILGAVKGMNVALAKAKIPYTVKAPALSQDSEVDLQAFTQLFQETTQHLGNKISTDKLMTAALNGMFEATGDPYTVYMTPHEFQALTEQMRGGDFGGIGIYIELEKGTKQLMVLEPIEDTPAWKAGLRAGDYILSIDGKSTKGITLDEAQQKIRGPIGTRVVLTIRHKGSSQIQTLTITRALIHVKSVTSKLIDGDIGYFRLHLFGEFTGDELEKAMDKLQAEGAKAYILDLRNNGGGYIDAAKEVCSKFLPRNSVIVWLKDRNGNTQTEYADGSEHPDYPMVVLVNEFSASASEIAAGALQDYKRAIIVGTRTFGKGSVQTISPLPNGGAVKITIAHYHTPNGADINKKGIIPNVIVPMQGTAFLTSKDLQLKKAVAILQHELMAHKQEQSFPSLVP